MGISATIKQNKPTFMKPILLLLSFLCFFFAAHTQTLNIQAGTTVSHLDWELKGLNGRLYDQNLIGYSFFVGMDYHNIKYFNLSSNIGMIRKGGMMELEFLDIEGQSTDFMKDKATLDYVSVNTVIDLKYPVNEKLIPFISIGPRADFLISSSKQFEIFKEQKQLSAISYGIVTGLGLKYAIARAIVGIRFDYYTDINNVASYTEPDQVDPSEIRAKMYSLNVSCGYKF